MLLTYEALDTSDLQGSTQADYLVAIEADLLIVDGGRQIYRADVTRCLDDFIAQVADDLRKLDIDPHLAFR